MDTPQLIIIHDTLKFRLSHVAGPEHAEIGPISDTLAGTPSMQTYRRISGGYSGNPKRARTLTMPGSHNVDGDVAQIKLPPGSGHGPLVHKPTLRQLGVQSAPQYRGALGMAYHWWDQAVNGSYILPYRKKLLTNPQGMALKKKVRSYETITAIRSNAS